MVVWLVGMVGGFKMPLPATCPEEFACMPEHFVEDAMELLIFASRIPKVLDGVLLVDFLFKCPVLNLYPSDFPPCVIYICLCSFFALAG